MHCGVTIEPHLQVYDLDNTFRENSIATGQILRVLHTVMPAGRAGKRDSKGPYNPPQARPGSRDATIV
jgi:hypothetical protein